MGDIMNYSKEALKSKGIIEDYNRTESNGVIKITYRVIEPFECSDVTRGIFTVLVFGFGMSPPTGNISSHTHFFDTKNGELIGTDKNEAAEKLNKKGCALFDLGRYDEAAKYCDNAYRTCSSGYENEQLFIKNRDKAQVEVDAKLLNFRGDDFFKQHKYREALSKYKEAYDKSQISKEYNTYRANRDRAQTEIDAIDLNSQGDSLFGQGKYSEAVNKYQEAYDKSQVSEIRNEYKTNRDKAKLQVDAINLNLEGDNLFNQGKYSEALSKYQEAYDKSQVAREKSVYKMNIEKTKGIVKELSLIDDLWNKAWNAEENGKSEEAENGFQKVLTECQNSLKTFLDNLQLKQYAALVSLKIEGNELFNQGLKLQEDGIQLLKQAQELKLKEKYKLTNMKFKEAKEKFIAAKHIFEKGIENDQRFASCTKIVQEQIDQLILFAEIAAQDALGLDLQNLNIDDKKDDRLNDDFHVTDSVNVPEYHEQI